MITSTYEDLHGWLVDCIYHNTRFPSLFEFTTHLGTCIICTIIHNYFVYFSKLAEVLWSFKKLKGKHKEKNTHKNFSQFLNLNL